MDIPEQVLEEASEERIEWVEVLGRQVFAFEQYGSICMYEKCEKLDEHIEIGYESGLSRIRMHKSAVDKKFICTVFYNQIGKVDIDYGLAKAIRREFDLPPYVLVMKKNYWVKKKPVKSTRVFK